MDKKYDRKQSLLIVIIVIFSLIATAAAIMVMLKRILKRYVTLSIDSTACGCGCDGAYFNDEDDGDESYIFEEDEPDTEQ